MTKLWTHSILAVLCLAFVTLPAHSSKYPNAFFEVHGVVQDLDSKAAVSGANVVIFLNDGSYADTNGWLDSKYASKMPVTDNEGKYSVMAILGRGDKMPHGLKVEIIVMKAGYRTERFERSMNDLMSSNGTLRAFIELSPLEIMKLHQAK